jgi:peptide deformylase
MAPIPKLKATQSESARFANGPRDLCLNNSFTPREGTTLALENGEGYLKNIILMAVRTILNYPDKRLTLQAAAVSSVNDEIRALVEDMAETMYAAPGVGLAAPQIGVLLRIFVIDIAAENEPSQLRHFINPEIVEKSGVIAWEEGCLSFPGVTVEIERAEKITVRALNAKGEPFELQADGLLAVAVQHEYDHLDGKLMTDRVSLLKRRMMDREMRKRTHESRP